MQHSKGKVNELISEYRKNIDDLLLLIEKWLCNDPVSLIYASLFNENIIIELTEEDEETKKLFEFNKKYQLPPGYKDSSKSDGGIGDFLIWRTILEIGRSNKNDLIFVSNDLKTDWWYKTHKSNLFTRYPAEPHLALGLLTGRALSPDW